MTEETNKEGIAYDPRWRRATRGEDEERTETCVARQSGKLEVGRTDRPALAAKRQANGDGCIAS